MADAVKPSGPAPANSPPDFLLEWYKLHRTHELELNKATLAYELELARLFVLLNGGAAGAFLTLTGAIWKDPPHPAFGFVAGAICCWLLGLLMAALATNAAYYAQRDFTIAYRLRRNGEELRRIYETGIKPRHLGIEVSSADAAEEKADDAQRLARAWSDVVPKLRLAAVFLFVVGGFLALIALQPSFTSALSK